MPGAPGSKIHLFSEDRTGFGLNQASGGSLQGNLFLTLPNF
jgi:hypothetical protein